MLVVELTRVCDLRDQLQGVADVLRRRFFPPPLLAAPPPAGAALGVLPPILPRAPLDRDERKHPTAVTVAALGPAAAVGGDRKSTRLNSSHLVISYAVFCLKKK